MHRFTRELKRLKQTQGAFLGPLKCSNHLEIKVKSCRSQKVGIEKWRRFFDSMQFAHAHCPLVGFICRKEFLQNGPQGQNQFWFTVSKTCSDFLGELVSFKMKSVLCRFLNSIFLIDLKLSYLSISLKVL